MTRRIAWLVCSGVLIAAPASAQQYDANAVAACSQFLKGFNRISDGVAGSVSEIATEMRLVYSQAERSTDSVLRSKAGDLVRHANTLSQTRSSEALVAAAREFTDYCRDSVLKGRRGGTTVYGPTASPSERPVALPEKVSQPIRAEEAERHLKALLDRLGDSNAKCTKKQYGTGWVTVCE